MSFILGANLLVACNMEQEQTKSKAPVKPAVVDTTPLTNILSPVKKEPASTAKVVTKAPVKKSAAKPNKVVRKKPVIASKKAPSKKEKVTSKKAEAKKTDVAKTEATDEVSTQQAATNQLNGNLQNLMGGNTRSRFRGSVEFGLNTDLKTFDDPTKTSGSSLFLRPRYAINSKYTALMNLWFDKGLSQGFEERLNDIRVGAFRNPLKYGKLLVIPNVIATIPASENSKRNQDMIVGLEFNPNLVYLQNDLLNFFFTPRIRRNFHQFTTSRSDQVNVEYSFMGIGGFSYNVTDRFSFQPAVIYIQNRTYTGTNRDPSYLTILEGRYQIDSKSYALFGTTTGGSIYSTEMGPDQNIELFDENTSSIYANYGFLF